SLGTRKGKPLQGLSGLHCRCCRATMEFVPCRQYPPWPGEIPSKPLRFSTRKSNMSIRCKGLTCLVVGLLAFLPARAEEPVKKEVKKPAASKFIRLQRDDKKLITGMDTAIIRYVPASGEGDVTVDLIAAVHVGDKEYYQKLNKRMEEYDVLLYELV